MFEESIELLKEYKEYLNDILSTDCDQDEDFDDLELRSKLEDCENDIENIEYSLPYDEIEEDDIPIEDMSGENLEDGELEDEIVEIEALIKELREMIEQVRLRYFDENGELSLDYTTIQINHKYAKEDFLEDLFSWMNGEIIKKLSKQGPYLNEEEIYRLKMCIYFDAKCRGDHRDAAELAAKECPELKLTEEEIRINHLFSGGLFHITFEMIKTHECLGQMMDFESTLNFKKSIWESLI